MTVLKCGIIGLLFIITGCVCSEYPDSAIRCVFEGYDFCYRDIASLGANSSARFDETIFQLNETCRYQNKVLQCISNIGPKCVILYTNGVVERIASFIQQLCSNRTFQQTSFLNSSACYNRYQSIRSNCVKKFYTTKSDPKSLCCSSLRTQQCLREDMRSVCPTEFQTQVVKTYSSHQFAVCGSHLAHCGTGSTFLPSIAPLIACIVSLILQKKVVQ